MGFPNFSDVLHTFCVSSTFLHFWALVKISFKFFGRPECDCQFFGDSMDLVKMFLFSGDGLPVYMIAVNVYTICSPVGTSHIQVHDFSRGLM